MERARNTRTALGHSFENRCRSGVDERYAAKIKFKVGLV
jgi:hypothetical protein